LGLSASEIFAECEFKSRYLYSISSEEEITEYKKTFKNSQRESCVWGTVYIVPKKGDLKPLDLLARYHGYVACKYYLKDRTTFSNKKAYIASLLEITLMPLQGLNDLAIFVPDIDRQC
jgi:hypothetical protein